MTRLQTKSLPTQAKLLYVFTKSAYSNATGQEGLDSVLIGAAFEQTVSLLFLYDGIYQLKADQDMQASGIKQYTKTFQALADYEVENIYVSELCLQARSLNACDLILETQALNRDAIASLISQQDRVFAF
jgi:tRNA 2-thiouridine synthesizing protein C